MLQYESQRTGISIHDLRKRKIGLGDPTAASEPGYHREKKGSHARANIAKQREHFLRYSLRVFAHPESWIFDMDNTVAEFRPYRTDPRWALQGYLQPVDEVSRQLHREAEHEA
jgi:hypothetical protein